MRICTSSNAGGGGSGTSTSSSLRSAIRVSARIQPCLRNGADAQESAMDAYRRRQAAVNRQIRTGDVGGAGRQQERDDAGDVFGFGEAFRGTLGFHGFAI